jgi:oligoendopeptidase F
MSTSVEHTDVAWDLETLVHGEGADGVERLLDEAATQAEAFAAAYQGKVAELNGATLAAAVGELVELTDLIGRAGSYASLKFAEDTAKPEHGALLALVEERGTAVGTKLLFFELEWTALDDDRAEELLASPGLELVQHHLRTVRREKPHLLSEPEERILAEKASSSRGAWDRLFDELTSVIEVELPSDGGEGESAAVPLDVALSQRPSPARCSPACAPARSSSTRCCRTRPSRIGCGASRAGSRRATSPTRPRTPPCRRSSMRCRSPTTCRSAGTA